MTSAVPATDSQASSSSKPKAPSSSSNWFQDPRNRMLAIGGAVVLVALIAWGISSSGSRKEEFASRALDQARSVAESGNLPLAASEFQKVITTYAGTKASQEAVINLNQVRLINGQAELAVVNLQDFIKSGPSAEFRAPSYGLLGRALEGAKRPQEAAEAYVNAANAADVNYLKAEMLLQAGRTYAESKQNDKALETYRKITTDYKDTDSRTEAEVRLAELTGGQM